jgi:hypothetical protein
MAYFAFSDIQLLSPHFWHLGDTGFTRGFSSSMGGSRRVGSRPKFEDYSTPNSFSVMSESCCASRTPR